MPPLGDTKPTTIIMSGELVLTVTPCSVTEDGNRVSAGCSRFCTLMRARSGSVPTAKVTDREYRPALDALDDMYSMPSTPLTASSMGPPTASEITWALAPGYTAATRTVGGDICGYWVTGMALSASAPARNITMATTSATRGGG